MEDLLYYTCLFDYYKDLFTKTKKDYFIDYYFNNLTQEEIDFIEKTVKPMG